MDSVPSGLGGGDGAQAKKQQRVPSRRHVRICTGEETERRVSMSNIYDIVINMPADPAAGLEGVLWCIGNVTVAPELHEELSRRLSHAFDLITGGGHRVHFMPWGGSTPLTCRPEATTGSGGTARMSSTGRSQARSGHERNQSLHDVHPVTVEVIEKNRLVRHFYPSPVSSCCCLNKDTFWEWVNMEATISDPQLKFYTLTVLPRNCARPMLP